MWDSTPALQGIAAGFVVFYLICYRGLVRFRFPRWLSARGSGRNAGYRNQSRITGRARGAE